MMLENPILSFIGGCHVAGYLVEETESFVNRLSERLGSFEVHRVPYASIGKLQRYVEPAHKTQSNYVFVQLGNFEFSASWKQILELTVGLPSGVASRLVSKLSPVPLPQSFVADSAPAQEADTLAATQVTLSARKWAADVTKVLVGSGLYLLTWVLMRRHRRQFRLVNQIVEQNPQTTFLFLSPFPSAATPHNILRQLGGLILQHRFKAHPNARWVNTHKVLNRQEVFLADGIHLNAAGHQVLADHLLAVCLSKAA